MKNRYKKTLGAKSAWLYPSPPKQKSFAAFFIAFTEAREDNETAKNPIFSLGQIRIKGLLKALFLCYQSFAYKIKTSALGSDNFEGAGCSTGASLCLGGHGF